MKPERLHHPHHQADATGGDEPHSGSCTSVLVGIQRCAVSPWLSCTRSLRWHARFLASWQESALERKGGDIEVLTRCVGAGQTSMREAMDRKRVDDGRGRGKMLPRKVMVCCDGKMR